MIKNFIWLPESDKKILPSTLQAPELEPKSLTSHLKYAYLGDDRALLVIVSSQLEHDQEAALIEVLKNYKRTVGTSAMRSSRRLPPCAQSRPACAGSPAACAGSQHAHDFGDESNVCEQQLTSRDDGAGSSMVTSRMLQIAGVDRAKDVGLK
ncbi:Unknown protein [Striga hermonthica]|uniref:Uncharacterized protein n=1 Tax=Striga hermonthica TaxID=68872 RepID=A0A9N7NGL2_STRHE|nr:Unknown protein [Striga hermonthica]